MFRLAKELSEVGKTVLTTTTTKIMMPGKEKSTHVIVSPHPKRVITEAENLLGNSVHITAGKKHLLPEDKLIGFEPDDVRRLWESGLFRWILVEADGAAQRPLKAPAAHEPVIPDCSTHVVAVVGLDAVGQSLDEERVFRPEIYSQVTGVPLGSPVSEDSVAEIILNTKGLMKDSPSTARQCLFLNKADNKNSRSIGRRIASRLREKDKGRLESILIGSAGKQQSAVEIFEADIA
jgi:probable selenium-dependent hydroxylase accessory protein YqeC